MDSVDLMALRQESRESSPDLPPHSNGDSNTPPYATLGTAHLPQPESDPDSPFYETVATVPIHRQAATQSTNTDKQTQPTQLLERHVPRSPPLKDSLVQVAVSSPTPAPVRRQGGFLASAMAPAGTAFRIPNGVIKAPPRPAPIYISDDDGPTYVGGSSDSDSGLMSRSDIRPSSFGRHGQDGMDKVEESPDAKSGPSKFQQITQNSVYKPNSQGSNSSSSVFDPRNRSSNNLKLSLISGTTALKRSSDTNANSYGTVGRDSKRPRQIGPSRALPILSGPEPDMVMDDIQDFQLRQKVRKMKSILSTQSVRNCYEALIVKKGIFDDAIDYLVIAAESKDNYSRRYVDLTGSEDELMPTPVVPRFNQAPKQPVRSIQEKWGSTQLPHKPLAQQQNRPVEPVKKGGRLVRGRKRASSPPEELQPATRRVGEQIESSDSDEADSALHPISEDASFEGRLLSFFNECTSADLADTAVISAETATYILSKKPFKSLNAVRQIPAENVKPSKNRKKPQPIGERVVDKCEEMIQSYEAVDYLVKKCEAMGKPLAQAIKSWGVNIFGSKDGELDLVSFKNSQPSCHDSGIGTPISDQGDERKALSKNDFISQPLLMGDQVQMKDYQVVGVNWLALLFKQKHSCILADDMGLGKTCQVIAFLAHLQEIGEKGPHLVVVPSSTLENWLFEFDKFCPKLFVRPLYASQMERGNIRDEIDMNRDEINVVITTYTVAKSKEDFPWLKHFGFCCTIFDEGHYLKNADSQLYTKLVRIQSQFRLLLTGTPLQNNLRELISLLGFLMPAMFREKSEELQSIFTHKVKAINANHETLLSAQRITRARTMLRPFILRRKKHQVLKDLPSKIRRVERCEMTVEQSDIYAEQQEKARQIMARRAAGEQLGNESANVLIRLRQAAIHPFMFRRLYTDEQLRAISKACLRDDQWVHSNPDLIFTELEHYSDLEVYQLCAKSSALKKYRLKHDEWMASGKAKKLCELLVQFLQEGHRTLIFSQFVMVLDILELVLHGIGMEFSRLDGNTPVALRQDLINEFNADDCSIPVFILSTKAGGAGINLAKANKVIIFDSGFNPQDDVQAENRAHRIGQEKEVEVVRLISSGTVEEQIYAMGLTKLALDDKVAGEDEDKKGDEKKEAEGLKMVEEMLFEKLRHEEAAEPKGSSESSRDETVKNEEVKLPKRPKRENGKVKIEAGDE